MIALNEGSGLCGMINNRIRLSEMSILHLLFIKHAVQNTLTCIWRSGPANCSVNLGISLDYERKDIKIQA